MRPAFSHEPGRQRRGIHELMGNKESESLFGICANLCPFAVTPSHPTVRERVAWRGDQMEPECEYVEKRNPRAGQNLPDAAAESSRDDKVFRRDAPTLLCYAALAGFAFWRYAFGVAPALLRAELHFSYTLVGVYSALWAVGAVIVGVSFGAMARRLSRSVLLWGSSACAGVGAGLFIATQSVAITLVGTLVLGFACTILLACIQVILSDRHSEHRDRALTEANIGASACAVLAPLILGLLQASLEAGALRWRCRPWS
jgi:hypothetical protein